MGNTRSDNRRSRSFKANSNVIRNRDQNSSRRPVSNLSERCSTSLSLKSKYEEYELSSRASKINFTEIEYIDVESIVQCLTKCNNLVTNKNATDVILIKCQISEQNFNLESDAITKLNDEFKKQSAVIIFQSEQAKKSTILWKNEEIDFFLVLQDLDKKNLEFKFLQKLCTFIGEFLAESLNRNHLGLISKFQLDRSGLKTVELDLLADFRDYNLLLLAAERGNIEMVEILLKLGIKVTTLDNNVNAQTLAMTNQHYDVVDIFLQNNLKFPTPFDIEKCKGKLREFCDLTENLHRLIKLNDRYKVDAILTTNKHLHHFYNISNESALKVAIVSGSFNVFDLLLERKFRFGSHEDPAKYYEQLDVQSKIIVRDIQHKYSQPFLDKHIHTLVSNSTACFDETEAKDKLRNVQQAFMQLSENYLIKIILMIVAAYKNFKIVFDFNRKAVNIIDPTTTDATQGIFYLSGRILIGAKQLLNPATEHETLAVLAHELCHFAMNIVYKNRANPYRINDKKKMNEFDDVLFDCAEHSEKEDVIDSVYNCYQDDMLHAELIVRVVHLLALYRNSADKLEEVRKIFKPLFEFYEQKTVPDLERALPELEERDQRQLKDKDKKIFILFKVLISITVLSIIAIISGVLITRLTLQKPVYSFQSLTYQDQIKLENAAILYKNVSITFYDLFFDNLTIYSKLKSDHISDMIDGKVLNIDDPHLHYLNSIVYHSWQNLAGKLKEKILHSNFTFQNESLKFKELDDISYKVLNSTNSNQIINILNGEPLYVHKMIANDSKFYIERKVFKEKIDILHLNFDDILEIAEKSKIFILSANAGTGKTVTFKQFTIRIKKRFSNRWVSYIDLKDHKEWYDSIRTFEDVKKMLEAIFNLNLDDEFEKAVLEESLKLGNVILLWDGFDEISPDYSESVLRIFKLIKDNSENIQFICTRPIYSEMLKKNLEEKIFILVPFTQEDRKNFIIEFSNTEKINHVNNSNFEQRVQEIIKLASLKNDFGTPLLLLVIGELLSDNNEINDIQNLYEIYQKFVSKKVEIWKQKFKSAEEYSKKIASEYHYRKFDMMKYYQFYALKNELYNKEDKISYFNLLKLKCLRQRIPKILINDEISRMGILYFIGNKNFEFAHRTFVEFFIAQFFIENIFNTETQDLSNEEAETLIHLLYILSNQQGITSFINNYFQDKSTDDMVISNAAISEALIKKFKFIFTDMINSYRFDDLKFFLNIFKKDQNLISEIFEVHNSETFYTTLFNSFHTRPYPVLFDYFELRDLLKTFVSEQHFEKLVLGENQRGIIMLGLYRASITQNDKPQTYFTSNQLMLNEYMLNSDIISSKNLLEAYKIISKNLSSEELKQVLQSEIILDLKFSHSKDFDHLIWTSIEVALSKQELKSYTLKMLTTFSVLDFKDSRDYFMSNMEILFTDSEIVEAFIDKSILHLAISTFDGLADLWRFFVAHSNQDQQKLILKQNFRIKCYSHCHIWKTIHSYAIKCSQLPKLNILQFAIASINSCSDSFDEIINIYNNIFTKTEIQKIISSSRDFLKILIIQNKIDKCKNFADYLKNIYDGNQNALNDFLMPKIRFKHQNIFELFKDESSCINYFTDLVT